MEQMAGDAENCAICLSGLRERCKWVCVILDFFFTISTHGVFFVCVWTQASTASWMLQAETSARVIGACAVSLPLHTVVPFHAILPEHVVFLRLHPQIISSMHTASASTCGQNRSPSAPCVRTYKVIYLSMMMFRVFF